MKRKSGQIEKVKNFLYQMGAWSPYTLGSGAVKARRKFRKIKRMAFERCPEYKADGAFIAIYHAFRLVKFDRYGRYWEDLRKCFPKQSWDNTTNKLVHTPSDFKRDQCRKWSLNGPILAPKEDNANAQV